MTVLRNRIPVSTYVNFGKFRGYTVGVKVAGIEDGKGGDIEAISCRWSTSSDYRRMFVCFFKNGRILLRMCRGKIRILDGGGDFSFLCFILRTRLSGCRRMCAVSQSMLSPVHRRCENGKLWKSHFSGAVSSENFFLKDTQTFGCTKCGASKRSTLKPLLSDTS